MEVKDLGLTAYAEAYREQERLVAALRAGRAQETLLLLQHPPVYTIGRSGSLDNVLDPVVEVVRVNRGGDVTFHGPGQLVGYPILDLGRRGRDLHRYLRFLEQLLIEVAADFGVLAGRRAGQTGVWSEGGKLASIGAGARHWVSMHGFALNVADDLAGFDRINPCGIAGCAMTSLERAAGRSLAMAEVKQRTASRFRSLLTQWLPLDAAGVGAP